MQITSQILHRLRKNDAGAYAHFLFNPNGGAIVFKNRAALRKHLEEFVTEWEAEIVMSMIY